MSPLLIGAILVAILGFVLLLKPELIWKRFQKEQEAKMANGFAALLRLVGIGVLILSVLIAQQV